jgi:hypothetical protein
VGRVIVGALVLVLLLVFILQNTRMVKISYFTATGIMPLGVLCCSLQSPECCYPVSWIHCESGSYVTVPPEKGNPLVPLPSKTSHSSIGRRDRQKPFGVD